jgi:curved DNA-binding protein CbpA
VANPYQILRIRPEADQEQIENAYHRMRRLVSYNGAGAGVTEQAINTAYAILSDPYRRARIDAALNLRRRGPQTRPETLDASGPAPSRSRGNSKGKIRFASFYTKLLGLMHLI